MSISCDSTYDQIKPTLQRLVKTALMLNVFSILGIHECAVKETLNVLPAFANHASDNPEWIQYVCVKGYLFGLLLSAVGLMGNVHLLQQRVLFGASLIVLSLPFINDSTFAFTLLFVFSIFSSILYICGFLWCHQLWGIHSGLVMLLVFFQFEIGSAFGWLIAQPFVLHVLCIDHDAFVFRLYIYLGCIGLLQSALMSFINHLIPQSLSTLDDGCKISNNGRLISNHHSSSANSAFQLGQLFETDKNNAKSGQSITKSESSWSKTLVTLNRRWLWSVESSDENSNCKPVPSSRSNEIVEPPVYILYVLLLLAMVLIPAVTVLHTQRHVAGARFKDLLTAQFDRLHEVQVQLLFSLLLPVTRLFVFVVGLWQRRQRWPASLPINYICLLFGNCLLYVRCTWWQTQLQSFCLVLLMFGQAALFPHIVHTLHRNLCAPLPNWEMQAFATTLACGNMLAFFWCSADELPQQQLTNVHLLLSAFSMLIMFVFRICLVHRNPAKSQTERTSGTTKLSSNKSTF